MLRSAAVCKESEPGLRTKESDEVEIPEVRKRRHEMKTAERSKHRRFGIIALVVLCAVLMASEIFGAHGLVALRRQEKDLESLQRRIQQLQRENSQLEMQIQALKSDPKTIEKQAREQLRLARPGETIYVLPEQDPQAQSSATHENPSDRH